MVVVMGARAEVVPEFVVPSIQPGGRSGTLEAAHGPVSAFEAPVVLLQAIALRIICEFDLSDLQVIDRSRGFDRD
jgi:hypothetical protein